MYEHGSGCKATDESSCVWAHHVVNVETCVLRCVGLSLDVDCGTIECCKISPITRGYKMNYQLACPFSQAGIYETGEDPFMAYACYWLVHLTLQSIERC